LLWLARPFRGRLLLAVMAGAAATGCGIALLAVSGFMLARASQHPIPPGIGRDLMRTIDEEMTCQTESMRW
jgi:ABC-type transport system involved in cytochrome bd biosynthesis fused ATPase/permease subunit